MNKTLLHITAVGFLLLFSCSGSVRNHNDNESGLVNLDHLRYLYTKATMKNGTEVGVINIYSEYPDYHFVIEPKEGFTCVDDVARSIVLFSKQHDIESHPENLRMIREMIEYILQMQSPNGYFYNFLWHDGSINKSYRTSLPKGDWWSWRALWAMECAYEVINDSSQLLNRIDEAVQKLLTNVKNDFLHQPLEFETVGGMQLPTWLPYKYSGDQPAILIIALEKHYQRTLDPEALHLIERFAEGLLHMQRGNKGEIPSGIFLSWQNRWHAYGNSQAYARLKAAKVLEKKEYMTSALLEIDYFYPYIIEKNFIDHFTVIYDGKKYEINQEAQFPQIAYGIRPMVFACLEAYEQTGKKQYIERAELLASWFSGNNPANQ
ncbi:MAG: hypothetical protein KAG99_05790, partial [Bacteroidales bacterium]|nr:hypothetical protein [Bacteroidales bacterium]